jgi:IS30 family transposase
VFNLLRHLSIKNENSQTTIAKALNRLQRIISKETKKNTGNRGHRHKQANRPAIQRHQDKLKYLCNHKFKLFLKFNLDLREGILYCLFRFRCQLFD